MRIVCFPHFYYLSEVSRLIEIGKSLVALGQEVQFFSHGGPYEHFARDEGFEVVSVEPAMSPERAQEYMEFNRGERGIRGSFFTYEELKAYVPSEADALRQANADAVLIGWNLPSYLSVQLVDIPIIVQQPGPFTAPFFDMGMGEWAPSLNVPGATRLPPRIMDRFINWAMPRLKFWIEPFNRLALDLGLPQYRSTLDLMAGDLTLVMDAPDILGIPPEVLESYTPKHPKYFHRMPKYRYGGPCYAKLLGEVPESVRKHFDTSLPKLYCAMGVSGSPQVLGSIVDIVRELDIQAVIITTTILGEPEQLLTDRVLTIPHVPAHLVNPLADLAITHGGAGTVQTAIHSATPLVGIPMQGEQAGNLALVRRQGAGLVLWKQRLTPKKLSSAIGNLVTDSSYKENMLRLKAMQDPVDGAEIAAHQIVSFLTSG